MSSSKLFSLYITAVLVGFCFVSCLNAQTPGLIDFQSIRFSSTAGETVDAEMGWLTVPELHSNRQSRTIRLPVLRFKNTAQKPGAPIVYLAGGPGASGLTSAKGEIFPLLMALRSRSDVIVFDQRGTGQAEPSLMIPGKFNLPTDSLIDDESTRRAFADKVRSATAALKGKGIDLAAYNTIENAEDIDDLRKALGTEKVIIWGHSYGTHLGLAYIKRHPESVEKVILGSINGLDQRWRSPSNLDDLVDHIDEYIDRSPKFKRQLPSLRRSVTAVFAALDKSPFVFTSQGQTIKIGKLEVQALVALRSGDIEFVKMLPMLFGQMQLGDFSFVAPLVVAAVKQRDWGTAMAFSMHIASGVGAGRRDQILKEETGALFGRGINYPFNDSDFLAAWSVPDLGDNFRAPVKSGIPALFMSATLDGRTSLADAASVREGFPNSRQVVIAGASHNFYHTTPAVLAAMQNFLDGKSVPERIDVPFDLRGPGERKLFLELKKTLSEKGVDAAVTKAREWNRSDEYLSSYVFGNLGLTLFRDEKKPQEAIEMFKLGLEIFPDNAFLTERLGEAYVANGMKAEAIAQYEKCLKLDPLNRVPAVKLSTLR